MKTEQGNAPDPTFDLFALGEALVDLISSSVANSLDEADAYNRYLGGQPTNLAINMALLGKRSAVAACIGDDGFGRYVFEQIKINKVYAGHIQFTATAPTSVAIITREAETADFLINRGADPYLQTTTLIEKAAASSRIVHTSAFGLSREPARTTILGALQIARQAGAIVSLNPNYHPKNWPDTPAFPSLLKNAYQFVTLTKPSLDDCIRLFGPGQRPAEYARRFLDWGCQTVALTLGSKGLLLATSSGDLYRFEGNTIPVVDATGAGDAYWAGFLTALLDNASVIEAAQMGQVVAEIKLGTVGPVKQLPGYDELLHRASAIQYRKV